MNERLVTAQGASIDLEWRNGAPWRKRLRAWWGGL